MSYNNVGNQDPYNLNYVPSITFSDGTVQRTAGNFYNGSFEDLTTQVSTGTTSATLVTFNKTTNSSGITIDTPTRSKIIFTNAGVYQFTFTGQYRFSGGASGYNVTMWYAKNGANAANSSRTLVLTNSQGSQTLGPFIDQVTVGAGDYIQFYWWTNVAPSAGPNGIYLYTTPAGTDPIRPAAPSVTVNVFNVG